MAEDKYSSCLLDASTIDMEVGMTTKLSLLYCPEDYGKIEWTANPKNIVSMEEAGNSVNITGLNKGVCTITVNIDGQTLDTSCSVNVTKPYSIEISPEELIVSCGENKKLDYHIKGKDVAGTHVKWKSGRPGVASVSDNGIVTGHTEGEAEITATINVDGSEDSATCQIKVFPPLCTPDTLLITGESRDIRLSLPKDHTLSSATWKITEGTGNLTFISNNTEVTDSNNTEVTEITGTSESVTVKGIAEGMAKVIVLAKVSNSEKEDKDMSCEVKVSVHKVAIASNTGTSVNVDKTSSIELTIPEGYTLSSTTWKVTDGYEYLTFISNDQQVAEITETRKSVTIKGKSEGTAKVEVEGKVSSAEVDNITISCESTIKVLKSDEVKEVVKINQSQLTVPVDKTCILNSGDGLCLLKGNVIQDKASWKAKDTGIIEIKENKLIPTGVGSTVISASYDGGETYPLSCVVTVPPFFELSQKRTTILVGSEESLHIISKVESSLSYQWTNSNNSAVSCSSLLSDTITLKGSAKGRATITAYVSCVNEGGIVSYSESCDVTVAENQKDAIVERMDSVLSRYDASQMGYALDISFQTNSSTSTEMQPTTLAQGTETEISVKNRVVSLLLTSVQVHKEMYKPGCLEVTLETNAMLSDFCGQVTLHYRPEDNDSDKKYAVASTYHIFEKKKKGRYVTLKAYSVDKFLTIDKFSQAFTGKLLVDEIIEGTLAKYKENHYFQKFCSHITRLPSSATSTDANPNNLWQYTISNLQHLSIAKKSSTRYKILNGAKTLISKINEDDLKNATDYYEVEPVLPYNVQFEESFYDFLVRICNRNGEFLYVEDNKLHIGIPEATADTAQTIEEYDSNGNATGYEIEFSETEEEYCETSISGKQLFPSEYYAPIRKKGDDFAKNEDYYIGGAISLNLLKPIVESPHILDSLPQTALAIGGIFGTAEMFKKQANQRFIDGFGDYTKNDVYQFIDADSAKKFNNDYYAAILTNEQKAEQGKILVSNSTYKHHRLGDKVNVAGKDYVVYRITGGAKIIDGFISSMKIQRYKEVFEMVLVPFVDSQPYPIPLTDKRIRKASRQRATVTQNKDPLRLGRVRVKFQWQDENDTDDTDNTDNNSPWLNVTYPMASANSGFMFLPEVGDSVLVDFEDGNVEAPFVNGSFYKEDRLPSFHASTQNGPLVKSITSANGHHLTFTDLPGKRFGANLWPFSYFAKFGYLDNLSIAKEDNKLGGGFELADYYGFYSITGSTHDRKVSIKSPFGDVAIDAFQGITISAPSGNIKIEGKNVEISARNNLTITSGTNIANARFYSGDDSVVGTGKNKHVERLKYLGLDHFLIPMLVAGGKMFFDLSLYRTWLETLFRPIGGTLLLKSHRFMRMEAGKGGTVINKTKEELFGDVNTIRSGIIGACSNFNRLCASINQLEVAINGTFRDMIHQTIPADHSKITQETKSEQPTPSVQPNEILTHIKEIVNTDVLAEPYKPLQDEYKSIIRQIDEIGTTLDAIGITSDEIGNTLDMNNLKTKLKNWIEHLEHEAEEGEIIKAAGNYSKPQLDRINQQKCRRILYDAIKATLDRTFVGKDLIKMEDSGTTDTLNDLKKKITLHTAQKEWAMKTQAIASKAFGISAMWDDRAWGKNDTGNILLSAEKGKMFRIGQEGQLEPYTPNVGVVWKKFVEKIIDSVPEDNALGAN